MTAAFIWLTKMILSHLVTDFLMQPLSWVQQRTLRRFAAPKLYLHGLVTAVAALIITGFQYWLVALVILVTHILIDGWKSYQPPTAKYFIIDQLLHLLVILVCWYAVFFNWGNVVNAWQQFNSQLAWWKLLTAVVFLTTPAGFLIEQLTRQWREQLPEAENLANAGKWIGMIERLIILVFVLLNQYAALGLLVAAKGIIRFSEKDRQEIKTEYLVIGTLISIGTAMLTGLLVKL